MSYSRKLSSLVFALVTFAGAGMLMSSPAQADNLSATFGCNDMACYGANTCERHGGTHCDLHEENNCRTCLCGTGKCGDEIEAL